MVMEMYKMGYKKEERSVLGVGDGPWVWTRSAEWMTLSNSTVRQIYLLLLSPFV